MPPWFIERNVGVRRFKEDPSLSDAEIAAIGRWVDAGAPRGNPADAPPPIELEPLEEWRIGTPEWIVELPEPVVVGAVDADRWLDIWADSRLTTDRYIKAVETKPSPGAHRVVHHVATSMTWEEEDGEEGGGFLNEYAMGKNGDIFPDGTGRLIRAGTQIRFNMHYSSVGEEIADRTRVGLQFYPEGHVPERVLISRHVGDSFDTLDIPAGADNVRSDGYYVLPEATQVTGFQPHMHIRGKRMCVEAIHPDGLIETLSCTGHNFGWHIVYNYADDEAPLLPRGHHPPRHRLARQHRRQPLQPRPQELGGVRQPVDRRHELRVDELLPHAGRHLPAAAGRATAGRQRVGRRAPCRFSTAVIGSRAARSA